ncbi:MAG: magnesium/cobalt transporter CorA [Acidobacteriota bacterium]
MTTFHKAHPAAGARPGTLVIPAGSPPPRLFLMQYTPDTLEERELAGPAAIPADLPAGTVTWLDVHGYGDEAVIRAIGERFGMTALALEDAVNAPQRPKTERYAQHQLVISRVPMPQLDDGLILPQVCLIVGERYLVSFQERPFGLFQPVRDRIRHGVGRPIRRSGPDYLAYALIDTMVDRYYPIAEELSKELDDIEDALLEEAESETLARLGRARRRLVMVRRIAAPQREMVNALQTDDTPFVTPPVRAFLRDTYDHIAQVTELLDSLKDTAAGLSDELLSLVGQKTNEIMKVLTLMASIFIPLTFIAGIYGMNFEHMPELHYPGGYYLVLTVMAIVAAGMVGYFYRRGWMGRRRRVS